MPSRPMAVTGPGRTARAPALADSPGPYESRSGIACPLRFVSLAGHSGPVTEDEAGTVAKFAAACAGWGSDWGPVLYAEGYARVNGRITAYHAWCLDGETVVDPTLSQPG